MLVSLFSLTPSATEGNGWIFINGENLTRTADSAIIYRGIASTGQTMWGHDIVIDSDGYVVNIIEGGLPEGENLTIPEGHAVISAAGTKVQWFKANVKKGTRLYYDSYTQKLFICNSSGEINPYFTQEIAVTGEGNAYCVSNLLVDGAPIYSYDISVDATGVVIARGKNLTASEGGFILSAATSEDAEKLTAFAPVGAKCVIENGIATLSYDKKLIKQTAQLEIARYEQLLTDAIAGFICTDSQNAINAINAAKKSISGITDYKHLVALLESLDKTVTDACFEDVSYELRGAYHTPKEKDINAVREIVKLLSAAGLNTIILRASNGYGSFIPQPEGSLFMQDDSFGGFDVLKAYIQVCEEENIALALCLDVYYNEYASIAKPAWMSEPNGDERGLCDKYFSPANEEFKEYYLGYVKNIIQNYEIDTLIFDYLRYPKFNEKCDVGYDYLTINRFSEECGVPIGEANDIKSLLFDSPHWSKWVEFRTSLVSDMASSISETVKSVRNDITLIAAAGRDTVAHFYMQDAVSWVDNGLFDGLCITLYEDDSDENDKIDPFDYQDGFVTAKSEVYAAYMGKDAYFFAALEVEKAISASTLAGALNETRALNSDGVIFSSLNGFLAQNYHLALAGNALKSNAVSPLNNKQEAMKALLEAAKTKINGSILQSAGCDEATAAQALTRINDAILALNEGVLSIDSAQSLESDIAIIFASSPAKQTVMKEFEAITKLSLMHKINTVVPDPNPDPDQSDADVSIDESLDESLESIEDEVSEGSSAVSESEQTGEKAKIEFADILIYLFVGATTVLSVIAIVIAIRRKSKQPANHHMPRASIREKEKSDE